MKWPGAFAIVAGLLFAVQFVWPFHHRFASLPLNVGMVCLAVATIWGLARGPRAVRWSVALWLGTLALLMLAAIAAPASMSGGPPDGVQLPAMTPELAILGVASLVLSVIFGIRALRAEANGSQV